MPKLIDTIKTKLRIWLSITETENTFYVGTSTLAAGQPKAIVSPKTRISFSPFFTTFIGQVIFSLYNSEAPSPFPLIFKGILNLDRSFFAVFCNFKYNFSSREQFHLLKECLCQKP